MVPILIYMLIPPLTVIFYEIFLKIIYSRFISMRLKSGARNIRMDKKLEAKMMMKKGTGSERGNLSQISGSIRKVGGLFLQTVYNNPGLEKLLVFFKKRRAKQFKEQFPDVVDFISGMLKAGYSLMQAVQMVSQDGVPPVSEEFGRVIQEISMGKSYEEAFDGLVSRYPDSDIEIFATAIVISKESGGNLTSILDSVAETLRDKAKTNGEIKSLTAQGRLSGLILVLLPIGVFIFMTILNPDYVKPMFVHPLGQILLIAGIGSQILGSVVINKMVNFGK